MLKRTGFILIICLLLAAAPPRAHAGSMTGETAFMDGHHVHRLETLVVQNWLLSLYMMTEQFTVTMMHQVKIVGAFLDAKHQLETQRLLRDMEAQSHARYHPSTEMCTIGTNMRSIAMSEHKGKVNATIMNNAMLQRNALSGLSAGGRMSDLTSRFRQYRTTYCHPDDNDYQLRNICENADEGRANRDIDFIRLVESNLTLEVDLTEPNEASEDQEDVFALSRNLFGHFVFPGVPGTLLEQGPLENSGPGMWILQNQRSLQAVRGVAHNSFSHLVGMRASGGAEVYDYMSVILEDLLDEQDRDDIAKLIGENPSYFAQMEVLTKRLYQSPKFFSNLYTKPENVQRLGVSLQAIGLMHDRDRFEAALRREMLISQILEMKIRAHEASLDNFMIGTIPASFMP